MRLNIPVALYSAVIVLLFLIMVSATVPRVAAFTAGNQQLREWSLQTAGAAPHKIALYQNQTVWFTEIGTGAIARLDPSTNVITQWQLPSSSLLGTVTDPDDLAVVSGTVMGGPLPVVAPFVWFDLRRPQGLVARLIAMPPGSGSVLQTWIPEDPAVYSSCQPNPVFIHGLQPLNFTDAWIFRETDQCSNIGGPVFIHLSGFNGISAHMFSVQPQGFGSGSGIGGDFLMLDSNHTVWWATDCPSCQAQIYHLLSFPNCIPTASIACKYESWPTYGISGTRPQAIGLDPQGNLWVEDREYPAHPSNSLLEGHFLGNNTGEVWITPSHLVDNLRIYSPAAYDTDLIVTPFPAPSLFRVYFTEYGSGNAPAGRVTAFDPKDGSANFTFTLRRQILNATVNDFYRNASTFQINATQYTAKSLTASVTCSAPFGFGAFSECPVNIASYAGAGPNGIVRDYASSCLWFAEQDSNRIGRLCGAIVVSWVPLGLLLPFLATMIALPKPFILVKRHLQSRARKKYATTHSLM